MQDQHHRFVDTMEDSRSFSSGWGQRRDLYDPVAEQLDLDRKNLLAKEMNELTVQERERVYEEIHGVADIVEETPELVAASLQKMRSELAHISRPKRKALDRAFFLRPGLETDDKLHMMFLRCDRFDAAKAAAKMCRHFEHKLMLFGDEALPRDITLDDLTDKEMALMYRGANIFFSPNDRGGRNVRLINAASFSVDDWQGCLRYLWYQVMAALEDEEVQKRGVVDVSNFHGEMKFSVSDMIVLLHRCKGVMRDWPMRNCGFHLCYENPIFQSFINALQLVMGKDRRLRERSHFGSKLETRYILISFGILLEESLTEGCGSRSSETIDSYLADRRGKEAMKKSQMDLVFQQDGVIPYPNPADVMMGRSKKWIGNTRFASLVNSYTEKYNKGSERLDKTVVAMEVLHTIHSEGGRFIDRTKQGWKVVDDSVAREKISQALRMAVLKQQQNAAATLNTDTPKFPDDHGARPLQADGLSSNEAGDEPPAFPVGPNKRQRT